MAKASFNDLGAQILDRWVAEASDSGFDGAALVDAEHAAVAANSY